MRTRLIPLAVAGLLVAACAEDATVPNDTPTSAATAADDQVFPGRFGMHQRLRAEGDAETLALLDKADEAREKARDAYRSGDTEAASIHRQEAMAYMHTAVKRTFPELAERMEQRREACQNQGDADSCRMGKMGRRGTDDAASGRGMMREGQGRGRMAERWSQLRAEADEETLALLDQAAAAREAAKEAFQAGNEEEAKAKVQEAREAMHAAMTRIDPEVAGRRESRRGQGMRRGGKGRAP